MNPTTTMTIHTWPVAEPGRSSRPVTTVSAWGCYGRAASNAPTFEAKVDILDDDAFDAWLNEIADHLAAQRAVALAQLRKNVDAALDDVLVTRQALGKVGQS